MLADRVRMGSGRRENWGAYENVALKGIATASSHSSPNTPLNAIDGNTSTRWMVRNDSNPWLEIDLVVVCLVDSIRLIGDSGWPIKSYTFQYYDKNNNWNNIVSVSSNSSGNRLHTFSPVKASKIRLVLPNTSVDAYNAHRVHEIEIMGRLPEGTSVISPNHIVLPSGNSGSFYVSSSNVYTREGKYCVDILVHFAYIGFNAPKGSYAPVLGNMFFYDLEGNNYPGYTEAHRSGKQLYVRVTGDTESELIGSWQFFNF